MTNNCYTLSYMKLHTQQKIPIFLNLMDDL